MFEMLEAIRPITLWMMVFTTIIFGLLFFTWGIITLIAMVNYIRRLVRMME